MKTKPNDDQDDSRPVPCILYSTESFTDAGTRKSKAKKKKKDEKEEEEMEGNDFILTDVRPMPLIPLDDYYGPFLPIERHRSRWD